MSDHDPRLFENDEAVRLIGAAMMARTLAKEEWTHEAHLGTCAWLILEHPEIVVERDLPDLIRRYNVSVGGVNDSTQGYHETITQLYILGVRLALARHPGGSLADRINALLTSPEGTREWPMRYYSRERLFSTEARLGWVEPDLGELPRLG